MSADCEPEFEIYIRNPEEERVKEAIKRRLMGLPPLPDEQEESGEEEEVTDGEEVSDECPENTWAVGLLPHSRESLGYSWVTPGLETPTLGEVRDCPPTFDLEEGLYEIIEKA
jgi:hypothetical protein